VLSPGQMNLSVEFETQWLDEYRRAAHRAIRHLTDHVQIPHMAKPRLLAQSSHSMSYAASLVRDYAERLGADLIVTATHGRSGWSRFFRGSFSETLTQQSSVPVMTIGPGAHPTATLNFVQAPLQKILFPTDFGPQAASFFRQVVSLASLFNAKVQILHAVPHSVMPVVQSAEFLLGGAWMVQEEYFGLETERLERRADAWARWAVHQGVESEVLILHDLVNFADLILETAERSRCGLIALETEESAFKAVLLGSVSRNVMRHAKCPVWALSRPGYARQRNIKTANAAITALPKTKHAA
jgi:nucleotide-binding universal stress UspA family protein